MLNNSSKQMYEACKALGGKDGADTIRTYTDRVREERMQEGKERSASSGGCGSPGLKPRNNGMKH